MKQRYSFLAKSVSKSVCGALMVMLVLATTAYGDERKPEVPVENAAENVAESLRPFRVAAWQAMQESSNAKEMRSAVAKAAQQHVLPHAERLHQEALESLQRLPRQRVSSDQYTLVQTKPIDWLKLFRDDADSMTPGMMVLMLHQPQSVAVFVEQMQLAESASSAEDMGKLFQYRAIVQPVCSVELPPQGEVFDPKTPTILVEFGDKITAVEMKYSQPGYYLAHTVRVYEPSGQVREKAVGVIKDLLK